MIEATISRRSILTMTAALAWFDEPSWAQESKGSAGAFLIDLRSRLITVVATGRPRPRGDDPAVAIIVEAFDIPAIEHIVLGRDASAIGETLRERLALVLAYRAGVNLFVHAEDARGTETEVLDERPAERDTVVVTTRSAAPGKEAVTIRWRLRREGRRFRVVDVMQTGRSLAQSERASWEAALRRNHGDIGAAITDLEVDPRYGH